MDVGGNLVDVGGNVIESSSGTVSNSFTILSFSILLNKLLANLSSSALSLYLIR